MGWLSTRPDWFQAGYYTAQSWAYRFVKGRHPDPRHIAASAAADTMAHVEDKKLPSEFPSLGPFCKYCGLTGRTKARDILLKQEWRYRGLPANADALLRDDSQLADQDAKDIQDAIHIMMERLCAQDCELLRLFYIDGFTMVDIQSILGLEKSQAYALLERARKRLRELLREAFGDQGS
jgi:RNA polymerase sigma factor (sigma-70 family)